MLNTDNTVTGQPVLTGTHLTAFRTALGLTQTDMADLLDVSQTTIQRWERDRKDPPQRLQIELDDIYQDFLTDLQYARVTNIIPDSPWHHAVRFWRSRPELSHL